MKKYCVTIEALGLQEQYTFEAESEEEAEEIGRDFFFFQTCNYGVSEISEQDEE